MAIDSESRRSSTYYGDGLLVTFPFTFKVFAPEQVVAVMTSTITGALELAYPADFSVSLNPDQDTAPGGSITLSTPLLVNYTLTIKSKVPYNQLIELTNAGAFYPEVVNDGFDKVVIQIQQVLDMILHPEELPALQRVSYCETLPVTGTSVHVDFPEQQFAIEPSVCITINGAPTDVTWVMNYEVVGAVTYYTSVDITFAAGAVGKTYTLLVVSNG